MSADPFPVCSAILFCVLGYLYFMTSSVAILRSRIRNLEDRFEKHVGVKSAKTVLSDADKYLFLSRLGIFLSNLAVGFLFAVLFLSEFYQNVLAGFFDSYLAKFLATFIIVSLFTFLVLLLGQILRKIAFNTPDKCLCFLAPILTLIFKLSKLIIVPLNSIMDKIIDALGIDYVEERALATTAEEISEIVEKSSQAGEIDEDERELIQGVFDFSDTCVEEVMTPRNDVVSVGVDSNLVEVVKVYTEHGLSRLLVTGEELDDVKGILIAKDLMGLIASSGAGLNEAPFNLMDFARKAYRVDAKMKVGELLSELRKNALHMAVVIDEHGGVDGLVTLEDLLEELVGEIFDEHDPRTDFVSHKQLPNGDILFDGSALICDINDNFSLQIPEGEYDTIAGFVIHLLGRIPAEGEVVDFANDKLLVERIDQNRIIRLRLKQTKV